MFRNAIGNPKYKERSEDEGSPPLKYVKQDYSAYYEVRIVFLTCFLRALISFGLLS